MENREWLSDFNKQLSGDANTMFWQHSLMDQISRLLEEKKVAYGDYLSPKKLKETFELMALMVEVVE